MRIKLSTHINRALAKALVLAATATGAAAFLAATPSGSSSGCGDAVSPEFDRPAVYLC